MRTLQVRTGAARPNELPLASANGTVTQVPGFSRILGLKPGCFCIPNLHLKVEAIEIDISSEECPKQPKAANAASSIPFSLLEHHGV